MDELKILLGTMIDKSSLTDIQKQLAKEKISMNVDLNFANALKESKDDIKKLSKQFGEMFNLSDREALSFTKEYISKSTQLIKAETKAQDSLVNSMTRGREASEKAYQAEKKRQELAQSGAINKAADQEYASKQKLIEQMARGREQSELAAKAEQKRQELAQATASNKSADQKYKQEAIEAEKVAASASKINQVIASGGNEAKIEQLTAKFRSLGLSTEEIQKRLLGVSNAFNVLKGSSDNASLITNAKLLDSEYEKVNNQIKQTTVSLSGLTTESQRLTKLNSIKTYADNNSKAAKTLKNDFAQMYAQLNNPDLTVSGLKAVDTQFKSLKISARDAGLMGKTVGDSFLEAGKKFTSWITISGGIMLAVRQIKDGFSFISELDSALTNINYTMDVTQGQLNKIGNSAIQMSKDLNTSATNVLGAVKLYANSKETADSILQKAQPAVMLSNVTGISAEQTAKYLQTMMNQFDLTQDELMNVSDTIQSVSSNIAYDFSDGITQINEGISTSGEVARAAGMDLADYASMIGLLVEKTGMSGSQLGNSLKSIITRTTKAGKIMGIDEGDISKAEESLRGVGIEVRKTDGEFKAFNDTMSELSKKWDTLSDVEKANVSFNLAGTRQINVIQSLLRNWTDYEDLVSKANNSSGKTIENQDKYVESLSGHLGELSAVGQSVWNNALNSSELKSGVDLLTGLVTGVEKLTSVLGGLGTIVSGIGLYNFIKNFQQLKVVGEASVIMREFNNAVSSGTATNLTYANILKSVDTQTKINIVSQSTLSERQKIGALASANLGAEELKTAVSTNTLSVAEGTAAVTTSGFSTALKGLWATMLANPLLAVGVAVTAGITIWSKYKQSVEESRQATANAASEYGQISSSIDDYAKKYKNLHDELTNANTTEERQHEIKTDLLSLQKELNEKYGDEYGRINLVTEAYKDQTEAILAMNSAAAKNYLLENREGIESATRKMEQQRTYSLGSTGYMSNDYAKQMYDIVSQYADKGVNLEQFNAGSETGYKITFTGDAEQANKVIHDLANQVQDLQEKFKGNNFVESFLDNSANALKENNEVLDKYQEIYDNSLMAQIASDNQLSEGYTKAKNAVDQYNEAVASGGESKIADARNGLNDVKSSIDLTSDDWKRYGGIMTNVFDQASTGLYDFRDAINSNQDGIKNLTNDLKGLSKEDLLSMADDGQTDNFDKLVEAGKKYGLTAEDVITVLQKLKVVQDEVAESGAQAFTPLSKADVISNINSLSSGFESLDKIMNSMKDKNPFNYALLDDKSFKDTFSGLGEDYTKFIETISSSPNDVKATQSAFDGLVTTWIDSSGALTNLTEDNSNLAVAMLKNMGVANAEEVVASRLATAQEHLAAQKAYTVDMSDALSNATASEIPNLIDESTQGDIARVALAGLAIEKANVNGTALDTSGDIENIIALTGVIGSANNALKALNILKSGGNVGYGLGGKEGYDAVVSAAQKEVDDAIKDASEYKGKGANTNVVYGGGTKTNKPSSGSKEKTKKDFSEIFDWVQVTIDRVNEKIDKLKDKISDASGWKAKNQITGTALDEMSTKVTALESQLTTYQGKLKEAGDKLNETYIGKIKDGTMEVETVTDEVISNNIKDYQNWYDKINDVNKDLDETKKSMQELAKSRLDNIVNDFESITSLMDKYSSYSNNLLNLQKSLGEEISNSDYEQLIDQQEAVYNQLQKEYSSLSTELSKAVSAGTIKVGTEEWRKYNGELIDINSSMNDAVSSMNDFRKALMDLPFEQLQTVASEFDRLNSGMDTMLNVMGSGGTTLDGMITAKGLAQIALYGKQYANSKQLAAEYANAIEELNNAYENGSLTQAEYNEKINEYSSAQNSAVQATKEAEDAILQFRKNAIQEQIDDYNELIAKKKEALQQDKSYADYLDEVAEKQKAISTLQAKIDELSTRSDSSDRSAIAMRLQLENDLVNSKKDLAKTQADYAYDQQLDSLDKQAKDYEDAKDNELEELESSTDAQRKVIEDYLGQVKDNYKTVYNTLSQYGADYQVSMTNDLVSPWDSAGSAVDTFQSAVSDAIAQINLDLDSLDLSKLTEMVQTMGGMSGGGSSSGFEDITGTGTWHKNKTGDWYGASDDDYASDGVYTIGGKQYSFNEDGYMKTGWNDDSGSWRYFEPENGQMVKSTWRKGKDGKDYYLTSDGTMATDTAVKAKSGNGYYYVDGDGVWDGETLSYDDVKKKNISVSYKNGTDSTVSGLKNVGEDDIEELIVTKNGAILSSKGQDTVFTGSRTDVLRDFSKDPTSYITDKLMRNQMDLNSVKTVNRSASPVIQLNSPLMTVNNTDENTMNLLNNRLNVFATKELPNVIQQNMRSY